MRGEPHTWKGNSYHCETCGSSYHCGACNSGSGMMGHSMQDDEGHFFSCQDEERAKQWREKLFSKKGTL